MFAEKELKILELIFLGQHFDYKYKILCDSCHKGKHSRFGSGKRKFYTNKYKKQIEYYESKTGIANPIIIREKFNKLFLENICKKYIGIEIWGNELIEFKKYIKSMLMPEDLFNIRNCGIRVLNRIIKYYGIQYYIHNKQGNKKFSRHKTIWTIRNLSE